MQSQSPSLKTNYEIKNPKRDYIEQSLQIQESHNTKKIIFFDSKTRSHVIQAWDENLALIPIDGKSGFVSHTKHITEATNMDLFHSWLITCIMWFSEFENKIAYLGVVKFKNKILEVLGNTFNLHSNSTLRPRSVVSQSVSNRE